MTNMTKQTEAISTERALKLALITEAAIQSKDHPSKDARVFAKAVHDYFMSEQPAHQHIEHCLWARNGNQPCPHVQPAQQQEPVAWRYKPAREDNPRWEYTTNHPLDMGDGYIRPSLVEYCKCIEPLYAKEKPKLMLEKFREMEDLLEEPAQQEPATKEKIREAIVFNLPLYTSPQAQRTWVGLTDDERLEVAEIDGADEWFWKVCKAIEAKLKEKNT